MTNTWKVEKVVLEKVVQNCQNKVVSNLRRVV